MRQPNLFDRKYGDRVEGLDARSVLRLFPEDKEIVGRLDVALAEYDRGREMGVCGPSRSQVIRDVLESYITEE